MSLLHFSHFRQSLSVLDSKFSNNDDDDDADDDDNAKITIQQQQSIGLRKTSNK
jgi:hypothetical protein